MTFPPAMRALDPITLDIPQGEFICFLGPSGCGKSTLLRIIARLQQPTSGQVFAPSPGTPREGRGEGPSKYAIDSEIQKSPHPNPLPEYRERGQIHNSHLAFVFQDAHLLPWRSVLRNVALPLELAGEPKTERIPVAQQMLSQVGLSEFLHHRPAELSGGMKMRVSLARALVTQPSLLLLDEPFAALDEITRQKLDEQLLDLWRQRKMTVIFVTHSVTEAVFLSQRAIVFSSRPGRVVLDHRIDLPEKRDLALRSDPRFAAQCGILYQALEQGGHIA